MTVFQSTHSLRSATYNARKAFNIADVSIHALLAECDSAKVESSTGDNPVSIHALLAECDGCTYHRYLSHRSFNPRTPCGVRQLLVRYLTINEGFQSTHSLRSATLPHVNHVQIRKVSIHALLAECDQTLILLPFTRIVSIHALLAECDPENILPALEDLVSIHALLAECD